MNDAESLGAYRGATLVRLSELRDTMLQEMEKIIPKKDSYDRTCTLLAHKKVCELWRQCISDFEITVGHTLPEIQMSGLIREKERLQQRLEQFGDVAENLYLLFVGPLPSELADDAMLISNLQREAKNLRNQLVEAQHHLALHPKELDVQHVSLKQLWKVAQNALETAAKARAFGHSAIASSVLLNSSGGASSSSSSAANGKNSNNNNNNNNNNKDNKTAPSSDGFSEMMSQGMLSYGDYMQELNSASEAHDLRVELRKRDETIKEAQSGSAAIESALRTRIAEMKAKFISTIDKEKIKHNRYLRKLDTLHDDELSSLVTQVLAALGVSDPVAVEERVEETLQTLRDKRQRALDAYMAASEQDSLIIESDDEVLGDEEDAMHGDQPPSPTQRSLIATYRPGGVHKWEGQTQENVRKQLEDEKREHGIQHANYLVQIKARTMEWATELRNMQQKYEAEGLAANATVLREKAKSGSLQRTIDDLQGQLNSANKEMMSLKLQLDDFQNENKKSEKIALIAMRREADQQIAELREDVRERKEKLERVQQRLNQERSARPVMRDMWVQTEAALAASLFRGAESSIFDQNAVAAASDGTFASSSAISQGSSSSTAYHQNADATSAAAAHEGSTDAADASTDSNRVAAMMKSNLRRGVEAVNMVRALAGGVGSKRGGGDGGTTTAGGKPKHARDLIVEDLDPVADHQVAGSPDTSSPQGRGGGGGGGPNKSDVAFTVGGSTLVAAPAEAAVGQKHKMWSKVQESSAAATPTAGTTASGGSGELSSPRTAPSLGKRAKHSGSFHAHQQSKQRTKAREEHGDGEEGRDQHHQEDHRDDGGVERREGTASAGAAAPRGGGGGGTGGPRLRPARKPQQQQEDLDAHKWKFTTTTSSAADDADQQDAAASRSGDAGVALGRTGRRHQGGRSFSVSSTGHHHRYGSKHDDDGDDNGDDDDQGEEQQRQPREDAPHQFVDHNASAGMSGRDGLPNRRISPSGERAHYAEGDGATTTTATVERRRSSAAGTVSSSRGRSPSGTNELIASHGPVVVNDSLLSAEAMRKTLDIFNTPNYNDAEKMKALVITSTMKPIAVGALPATLSEKRFFLALSRIASFCDTVLMLPKNALPYAVRLQQQLTALGASKAPEDWKMMKKIAPVEICALSTYVQMNFSRQSERMRLLLDQQQQRAAAEQQQPHHHHHHHHHHHNQHTPQSNISKIESIFVQTDIIVQKVRSARIPDMLKDVTWDDLQVWQTYNDESTKSVIPARDAAQLLTQLIELLRLWNMLRKALVEHSVALNDSTSTAFIAGDGLQQQQVGDPNSASASPSPRRGGGALSSASQEMDGEADDIDDEALTKNTSRQSQPGEMLMPTAIFGRSALGASPPPTSLSALSRSRSEQMQRSLSANHSLSGGGEFSTTARVRNPRSIRQLIAASNTLVRSARRHVEAQRQASQRGESPQFTHGNLLDLRVVGSNKE